MGRKSSCIHGSLTANFRSLCAAETKLRHSAAVFWFLGPVGSRQEELSPAVAQLLPFWWWRRLFCRQADWGLSGRRSASQKAKTFRKNRGGEERKKTKHWQLVFPRLFEIVAFKATLYLQPKWQHFISISWLASVTGVQAIVSLKGFTRRRCKAACKTISRR